ncbi:hypothetical protein Q7C36_018538 [Tachysurus vachellii]|uniref:Uncharacterized protein n=1 Tax=Tachysurus vachellii TaxID=175792 RepID=A0AA88M198_TACVA|nr:hypothetical protein Q7C36_018538 [Tachysurus vachellii]
MFSLDRSPHGWDGRTMSDSVSRASSPRVLYSLHLSYSAMDPAVLIFLLYLMIAHDLVCGLIQYKAQAAKPHKRAALTWRSSARICHGPWRVSSKSVRSDRLRWKKTCRIVRKA